MEKGKVLEMIEHYKGECYDLCYELLSNYSEHEELFRYVCENYQGKPKNAYIEIKQYFSQAEVYYYKSIYGEVIDGIINCAIKECDFNIVNMEKFYENVWNTYSYFFHTIKEKAFAFYYTIIDVRIPYIYIGKPLSMETETYQKIIKNSQEYLKRIKYIFALRYSQKTERASLVLQLLESIESYETKVVILAKALDYCNEKSALDRIEQFEQQIQALGSQQEASE